MKIDDSIQGVPVVRGRDTRKTRGGGDANVPHAGNAGDSVDITPTSARLSQLESELAHIDSSDTGKVAAVRQAIAEGSFQVDEEAVATALVNATMDQLRVLGRRSR